MTYTKHGLCGVCGIYLITNTVNGKRYVGSSTNIGSRISTHFTTALRRYAHINEFYGEIQKFGRDSFSVSLLEKCTPEQKIEREAFWYEQLKPEYNMTCPAEIMVLDPLVREKALKGTLSPENQAKLNQIKSTKEYREKCKQAQSFKMRSVQGRNLKTGRRTPIFECMQDAAKWVGDKFQFTGKNKTSKIKAVIDGERKTAFGFEWKEVMPNG